MPEWSEPAPDVSGGATGAQPQVGGFFSKLNPFDEKQMSQAEAQSGALLESAKGGGFRVGENAAQPLKEALVDAQDDIRTILEEAGLLADMPQLGTGPYAEQVAKHVQQSGSGPQGILPVLQQLQTIMKNSEEALKIAMDNYREAEEQQKSTFNGNA